jgi:hypothetical protein
MENTLRTLAEFHYELGFIGQDEYRERVHVALWLSGELDGGDPRLESPDEEMNASHEKFESENDAVVSKNVSGKSTAVSGDAVDF